MSALVRRRELALAGFLVALAFAPGVGCASNPDHKGSHPTTHRAGDDMISEPADPAAPIGSTPAAPIETAPIAVKGTGGAAPVASDTAPSRSPTEAERIARLEEAAGASQGHPIEVVPPPAAPPPSVPVALNDLVASADGNGVWIQFSARTAEGGCCAISGQARVEFFTGGAVAHTHEEYLEPQTLKDADGNPIIGFCTSRIHVPRRSSSAIKVTFFPKDGNPLQGTARLGDE